MPLLRKISSYKENIAEVKIECKQTRKEVAEQLLALKQLTPSPLPLSQNSSFTTTSSDLDLGKLSQLKNRLLPKESVSILKEWLQENFDYPYPTQKQKQILMDKTGLSSKQIKYWFINARRRSWKNQAVKEKKIMSCNSLQTSSNLLNSSLRNNPPVLIPSPKAKSFNLNNTSVQIASQNGLGPQLFVSTNDLRGIFQKIIHEQSLQPFSMNTMQQPKLILDSQQLHMALAFPSTHV